MTFYENISQHGQAIALIEQDTQLSYAELQQRVDGFVAQLPTVRGLAFLLANNDISTCVAYLALLQQRHVVMMLPHDVDEQTLQRLQNSYRPNLLIQDQQCTELHHEQLALADDLALLLPTSGSTGSTKQVALSYRALQANAESIVAQLPISHTDLTLTTLAPYYSYGLSIWHTHWLTGACIVLNNDSVMSKGFWQKMEDYPVSSLAGVPYTWEMLLRLGFTRKQFTHLRYFTQAGGRLAKSHVERLAKYTSEHQQQFYVMYGQTEATARIAINTQVSRYPESVGQVIPGGAITVQDDNGNLLSSGIPGELVFQGENVMLGYTDDLASLAEFTPLEALRTGDIATCNEDGWITIRGRKKRFIKLFGIRISLDEVEKLLLEQGQPAFAVGTDQHLQILLEKSQGFDVGQYLSETLRLHPSCIRVYPMPQLWLTANGKPDYPAMQRWCDAQ